MSGSDPLSFEEAVPAVGVLLKIFALRFRKYAPVKQLFFNSSYITVGAEHLIYCAFFMVYITLPIQQPKELLAAIYMLIYIATLLSTSNLDDCNRDVLRELKRKPDDAQQLKRFGSGVAAFVVLVELVIILGISYNYADQHKVPTWWPVVIVAITSVVVAGQVMTLLCVFGCGCWLRWYEMTLFQRVVQEHTSLDNKTDLNVDEVFEVYYAVGANLKKFQGRWQLEILIMVLVGIAAIVISFFAVSRQPKECWYCFISSGVWVPIVAIGILIVILYPITYWLNAGWDSVLFKDDKTLLTSWPNVTDRLCI